MTTLVGPALRCYPRLFNASAPRSLALSGRRPRVGGGSDLARILVTGAAGFIGAALCRGLLARGHDVLGITRGPAEAIPGIEVRPIGDIGPRTDWSSHLTAADIVIHLADRGAPGAARQAAAALARAAAASGVQRLVYMSSVRAMGAVTAPGAPFRPTDPPLPRDAYGRAKLANERFLSAAAQETGLELVILRPPLVYGPNVKANFRALIWLAASGLPLPFAGIDNRRSLIFLDNLVDVGARAAIDPSAAGRVLLLRDTVDISTRELVCRLAAGLGRRRARLFAVPEAAFATLRTVPTIGPLVARLTLSLQVDDSATRALLDWAPPVPTEAGLATTARAFRDET
jgi:nucleoside-diphosphate-sugar epimerase